MNSYAKLENGQLVYAPKNFTTPTGSVIVNFDKNVTLMIRYGFKEVIDERPAYNEDTQYLTITEYVELDESIEIIYEICEIEIKESDEEKLARLEVELAETQAIVNELMMNMMGV